MWCHAERKHRHPSATIPIPVDRPILAGWTPASNCRAPSWRHRVCPNRTAQRAELSVLGELPYQLPQRRSQTEAIKRAGHAMPAMLQNVSSQ
jgi:hypothetical protein